MSTYTSFFSSFFFFKFQILPSSINKYIYLHKHATRCHIWPTSCRLYVLDKVGEVEIVRVEVMFFYVGRNGFGFGETGVNKK